MNDLLRNIADLSRCYGSSAFVKGGGGNSSVKNDKTVWEKPSGCAVASMGVDKFVALDREKLLLLDGISVDDGIGRREKLAKDFVADAVEAGFAGRPSVESPLHIFFSATYVIHTHPPLVNGMTCAVNDDKICKELFSEALWMDYVDPGITLYHEVSDKYAQYKMKYGKEPQVVSLKNHGIFAAADTPDGIDGLYDNIINVLSGEYKESGVSLTLSEDQCFPLPEDIEAVKVSLSAEGAHTVIATSVFDVAWQSLTPDHIVCMKAFAHTGDISWESIASFREEKGYAPKVFAVNDAAYAAGTSPQNASLILELARDGDFVKQLTKAFGGPEYMTACASDFIENWEVESYRRKQI